MSTARIRPSWRELGQAARSPRMLGLLALLAIAALVCVRLGAWQLDRAFERAEASRQAQDLELAQTDARELPEVLEVSDHVMGNQVGIPLTVTGRYDPGTQVLIADRVIEGERGFLVVTGLRTSQGAWLPVVRGFVTAPDAVAPVPQGEVTLLGSVAAGEAYYPQDLPAGQQAAISPAWFANAWGLPIYDAYLVLATPDSGMGQVPRPQLDGGDGVDLRNLGYAAEWYVFGGFALLVWYRMVRDEAISRRLAAEGESAEGESAEGESADGETADGEATVADGTTTSAERLS